MKTLPIATSLAQRTSVRFIGREPILDVNMKLYGHELLFHSKSEINSVEDEEHATQSVIDDALLLAGPNAHEASFIRCTKGALLSGIVTLLPPKTTVLQVAEGTHFDLDLFHCCSNLREAGYRIALHGSVSHDTLLDFSKIAHFVKLDFTAIDAASRKKIYSLMKGSKVRFIAEQLDTESAVETAWSEDCHLFQGYFFCKPIIATNRVIPQNHLVYMSLLAELSRDSTDLTAIEKLVMSDTSICYRLLRLVNSALYALPHPVESIRDAVMMIGENEFSKLVTVALANLMETPKARAAARVALERAKFCELLAPPLCQPPATLYLLGMLSLMDVILAMSMEEILERLPLDGKIKAALRGEKVPLATALDLARAREAGGWLEVTTIQEKAGLDASRVSDLYRDAVKWVDRICAV